ncbi:MAG TPA: dihydroneopterin aldolase [Flavisolibacter sp.]|nr:dihydroneopterin aldolase [Flavisolibacter sp.]
MAGVLTIQLENVRFFAAHGLYKEEALLGNEFEVDASISYKAPKKVVGHIEETVDYVKVYQLIEEVMLQQQELLETCAMIIADRIQQQFPYVKNVTISIRKIHAPITNFAGRVGVKYSKRFK